MIPILYVYFLKFSLNSNLDTKHQKRGEDFKVKLNNRLENSQQTQRNWKKADCFFKKKNQFFGKKISGVVDF